MKGICLLIFGLIFLWEKPVSAQRSTESTVVGEYMLTGVMETAAGFLIKADHTFEYGFTYGAADKHGKGTWKISGNKLILNSNRELPKADFILKSSNANFKNGVRIKITDSGGHPYAYVKCRLGANSGEETTNNQGEAFFKTIEDGILEMFHPIFSTRVTQIKLNKDHTDFVFYPAYDLSEVFFNNIELQISPKQLKSKLLPGMPPQDAAGQRNEYIFRISE